MDFKNFENFQGGASAAGVIFYYAGWFDSAMVHVMSTKLKDKLQQEPVSAPIKRKLFSSFIEMAQNVLHYGSMPADHASDAQHVPGSIGIGQDGEAYWIACGNLVPIDQIQRMHDKLSALKSMSIAEIKAAYRAQLANDAHETIDTTSKGAGLGLLTIARDSRQPIEFEFISHPASGEKFSYFYIKTVI